MRSEIVKYAEEHLRAKKTDAFEIFCFEKNHFLADARKGEVESLENALESGLAIRVISGHRIGFSYTTSMEKEGVLACVDRAVESSFEVDSDEAWEFVSSPKIEAFEWRHSDDSLDCLGAAKKIEKAIALEAAALSEDTRVTRVRKAAYEEERKRVRLVNSNGVDLKFERTLASCAIVAIAEERGDSQWAYDFGFSHTFGGLNVDDVGKRAARAALSLLGARTIPTRKTAVCLHPYVAGQFLEVLANGFQGDNIYKGKSVLATKLGKKYYSDCVSIVNDGLMKGGYDSSPFDAEGSPSRTTHLVKEGVVAGWLADSYWGRKLGISSTGSSSRGSIKEMPAISPCNIHIYPGKGNSDSLLKSMDMGLYVTHVIGAHTINPITGDFSVGAEGQWVEGGIVRYPVKGVMIAGNVNDLFGKVVEVGNDLTFMAGVGSPTLFVSEMQVAGSR